MTEKQSSFRPHVEKRRILLIEDEMINQQILQMVLKDSYDVIPAVTGTQALEVIHEPELFTKGTCSP